MALFLRCQESLRRMVASAPEPEGLRCRRPLPCWPRLAPTPRGLRRPAPDVLDPPSHLLDVYAPDVSWCVSSVARMTLSRSRFSSMLSWAVSPASLRSLVERTMSQIASSVRRPSSVTCTALGKNQRGDRRQVVVGGPGHGRVHETIRSNRLRNGRSKAEVGCCSDRRHLPFCACGHCLPDHHPAKSHRRLHPGSTKRCVSIKGRVGPLFAHAGCRHGLRAARAHEEPAISAPRLSGCHDRRRRR